MAAGLFETVDGTLLKTGAAAKRPSWSTNAHTNSNNPQFDWNCSNDCSCLPPIRDDDVLYMHQSYKTEDQTRWPTAWVVFRKTWLDLHRKEKNWIFVFWLDEHNELLARCTGSEDLFEGRSVIQKADLARILYLHRYGGLYADMDYVALRSQRPLLESSAMKDKQVLLQGRKLQPVGLEWGFARTPDHPFWTYCLRHHVGPRKTSDVALLATGPKMLNRCLRKYADIDGIEHMREYKDGVLVVEPELIAPIHAYDFNSTCGIWRKDKNKARLWMEEWDTSKCRQQLLEQGSYAVTFYTQSWGSGKADAWNAEGVL